MELNWANNVNTFSVKLFEFKIYFAFVPFYVLIPHTIIQLHFPNTIVHREFTFCNRLLEK